MFNNDRGRYLAAGLATLALLTVAAFYATYSYWLGNLSGFKEAETRHYEAEFAERTDERINDCLEVAPRSRDCIEKALKDNREQQRSERNLNAQTSMADWAFWMLIVSTAGMGITAIGTIFLVKQVQLTRDAVRGSQRLLDLEQLPFIVLRPIDGEKVRYENGGFEAGKVRFVIQNMGRGPAFITAIYRHWSVRKPGELPEPLSIGEVRPGFARKEVEIPIGPGQSSDPLDSWSDRILKPAYKVGDKTHIFFYGYIEFRDISEKHYVAGFMYTFRQDAKAMGLHLALPETRAGEYNYQRALDA